MSPFFKGDLIAGAYFKINSYSFSGKSLLATPLGMNMIVATSIAP
jgi:hypothetical protein